MDAIFDLLDDVSDNPTLMVSLLVFLAVATLAFSIMAVVRVRGAVKRRAADVATEGIGRADDPRSLRYASRKAAQRLVDYTTRHYSSSANDRDVKQLRQRLVQAGFLDPRATAFFFIARLVL